MLPLSEINVGDVFSDPMSCGYGKMSGLEWYVMDKKEGMIKMQAHRYTSGKPFGLPIWKKSADRMFSEARRR